MRPLYKFNKCERLDDYSAPREAVYCGEACAVELDRGGLFFSPPTGALFFDTYVEARHRLVEYSKE